MAEIVVGAGCDYLAKVAGYYFGEIITPLALVTSWVLYNEKYLGLYAEKFLDKVVKYLILYIKKSMDNVIVKYLVLYIVKYLSGGKITMDGLQSENMDNYLSSLDRACDLIRQGKMYTSFVPAMYKQYCSTDFNEKMNNYLSSLDRACDLMRQGKMFTSFVPAMYKQYCSTDFNNICRFADMSKMLDIDTFFERLTQTTCLPPKLLAAWNF